MCVDNRGYFSGFPLVYALRNVACGMERMRKARSLKSTGNRTKHAFLQLLSFPGFFLSEKDIQASDSGGFLVKTLSAITMGVGVATLLFAGYVFLKAIPDAGRYFKMSRM